MIDLSTVQQVLAQWWCNYDAGNFDALGGLLTHDTRFTCRTDTGTAEWEEFVRADVTGHDAVLAWQTEHRTNSPYPLRHNGTNVHLANTSGDEAAFSSYLFVTHVVNGAITNLSSAICTGTVRVEDGVARLAELNVVLDTLDSVVFATRATPA
jgi:hypothetical protein